MSQAHLVDRISFANAVAFEEPKCSSQRTYRVQTRTIRVLQAGLKTLQEQISQA